MTAPVVQPRLAHAARFRPQQEQQAQAYLPRCAGTCLLPEISPWKNHSHTCCLLRTCQKNKSHILLSACCSPGHQRTPCRWGLLSRFLSHSVPSQRSKDVADAPALRLHCFVCSRGRWLPCPFLPFHSSTRGHKGSSCSLTGVEDGRSLSYRRKHEILLPAPPALLHISIQRLTKQGTLPRGFQTSK